MTRQLVPRTPKEEAKVGFSRRVDDADFTRQTTSRRGEARTTTECTAPRMSHRRKHVQALAHEREVTLRRDVDVVCVVTDTLGSNLLEVRKGTNDDDDDVVGETTTTTTTVIRVPAKFKNLVYFRSGMYVVATFVGRDELEGSDAKVTGELVRVLYADQVKELKKRGDGSWPASFQDAVAGGDGGVGCPLGDLVDALREDEAAAAEATARGKGEDEESDDDDDDDDLPPLIQNRNRRVVQTYDESSSEEDSDSD